MNTLKNSICTKSLLSLLMAAVLLVFCSRPAQAATLYTVEVYDKYGVKHSEYMASSDSGYYNVDTVMKDTSRAGYTSDYRNYKAAALVSGKPAARVRFRNYLFDPNLSSNWVNDKAANKYQNVYEAQLALNHLDYNPENNIDGYWGSITKLAVVNFQSSNGLTTDGSIGPATWTKLATNGVKAKLQTASINDTILRTSLDDSSAIGSEIWDRVRSLLQSAGYNKSTASNVLSENDFEVQWDFIGDNSSSEEVVGFRVLSPEVVELIIR